MGYLKPRPIDRDVIAREDFLSSERISLLRWPALFTAIVFAAMYFLTAIPRILYPYDLDFIEDGMLMESLRFATGRPVFLPPNAEFVPHVYMPLYPWLGGLLFKLTGPGFVPLRLLSLVAVAATCGLIYRIGRHESGLGWVGVVCAGLYLAGYRIGGFWYELVRVDSLFVALVLSGIVLASAPRGATSNRRLIAAAIVLALAFFTKQTGLIFGMGLAFYLLLTAGRRAWLFGLLFAGLTLVLASLLNMLTGGWFFYYTFDIASANPIEFGRVAYYAGYELLGLMAGLSVMAIGAGLLALRRAGLKFFHDQPWLIWIAVAVVVSGLGRASVGGNLNNLIPAYTLLCLSPALLLREWRAWPDLLPRWSTGLASLLILAQFALGAYNPLRYVPDPALRRSGDRLIERIAAVDGEVLVFMHPYYAWLAGKEPSAQMATIWHARRRGAQPLPPDFVARIQSQYYAAIISDNSLFETEPALRHLLTVYYRPAEMLGPDDAPATTTGMVVQPQVVYMPR